MNRYQWIALGVFGANLALVFLFPPVDLHTVATRIPIFGGFQFVFDLTPGATVNRSLLELEAFVILVNAGIAWELLRGRGTGARPRFTLQSAVLLFTAVNLILVLLFPPFESVFALSRAAIPSFEGFYFIFDRRPAHVIVTALLYVEVCLVLANGAIFWLLFRVKKPELTPEEIYRMSVEMKKPKK